MDHDLLLLDLGHLDDPQPPSFGARRAEEATRRAADLRSRRAWLVAAVVLAVCLVAGIGVANLGGGQEADLAEAPPVAETLHEVIVPDLTTQAPGTVPAQPAPTDPPLPVAPGAVTTLPSGASPGGPATSAPITTRAPPVAVPPTLPPAVATGQPPQGTSPAPGGVRFTLTLDSSQVAQGADVHALIRVENSRGTAIELVGGGCSLWRAQLYEVGRPVTGLGPICGMALRDEVGPGRVLQADVLIQVGSEVRPGTYDAFAAIGLQTDSLSIHTERVIVTVVRP